MTQNYSTKQPLSRIFIPKRRAYERCKKLAVNRPVIATSSQVLNPNTIDESSSPLKSLRQKWICSRCHFLKKKCQREKGSPCGRCIKFQIECVDFVSDKVCKSRTGVTRGPYRKTVAHAQVNYTEALNRRRRYCARKFRETGRILDLALLPPRRDWEALQAENLCQIMELNPSDSIYRISPLNTIQTTSERSCAPDSFQINPYLRNCEHPKGDGGVSSLSKERIETIPPANIISKVIPVATLPSLGPCPNEREGEMEVSKSLDFGYQEVTKVEAEIISADSAQCIQSLGLAEGNLTHTISELVDEEYGGRFDYWDTEVELLLQEFLASA